MRRAILVALVTVPLLPDSTFGTGSSVPFIDADAVHAQGWTGQGVTVAVIDTGIFYNHPGLAGSIAAGGMSWIDG
jgi:subtilisin family serine protease